MLATLTDLLAPVSLAEFLEGFRARKRMYIPASDPTRAEELFPWQDIDTFMSGHGLDENVGIWRESVRLPRQLYTSNNGQRLNVRSLQDVLAQGVSIVVDGVHRTIPQIGLLAAAVEREMGLTTQVNAYLSFSKGGAFRPHWDIHDVLAVQVHGRKRWRFWKAIVPHPIELADSAPVDATAVPDQEIDLSPGDVLFVPRGEPHAAAISAGHSVHLTIGLRSESGIDFIKYIQKKATEELLLRMNLPRNVDQLAAHEGALKRQLHQLIDAASMSQFLLEGDLSRAPAVQIRLSAALPRMDDVLRLTLRRRVPLPDVSPSGDPQSVTIGGEARRLSPTSIDALRWLFEHDPATVRRLYAGLEPHHGHGSIEATVRELLRLGFLAVN